MPIVDDPSVPNPTPPTIVASPDRKLFAWSTPYGIQLRANFRAADGSWTKKRTNLCTDPSFANVSDLSTGGGAHLSLDSSWSGPGSAAFTTSCKITPSGTDSASAVYVASAANVNAMLPGETYTVSAWIRVNQAQTGTLNSNARKIVVGYIDTAGTYNYILASSSAAANTAGTVERLSVTVTMPENTKTGLVRLMNGSAKVGETVSWDLCLIEEGATLGSYFDGSTPSTGDFNYAWLGAAGLSPSVEDPAHAAYKIRFLRDGIPVRSGNDRVAVAAVANAFDHEAPLDSSVTYQAVPVNQAGELGTPSDEVTISTVGLSTGKHAWLKSTNDPAQSMQIEMQGDPDLPFDGRDTLSPVQGSQLQAGGIDTLVQATRSYVFKTYTVAELEQLLAILTPAWTLFVQIKTAAGIRDFYAARGSVTVSYFRGSAWPERLVTVELKPVPRPTTVDSPLVIPGHSFNDSKIAAPTFADRLMVFPTFNDPLGIPEEVLS